MADFLDELKKATPAVAGGLVGGLFNMLGSALTNNSNRKISAQNNAFNAQQADINRQWQEDMYNKYTSPSAMVRQYQEAGLNPALANQYNGQIFSGSTAQSAGNIASVGTGLESIIPSIMSAAKLAKDMEVANSEINKNNADADLKRSEIPKIASDIEVNNKNIEWMQKQIEDLGNQIKNRDSKTAADIDFINAQTQRIQSLTPKEVEELESRIKELNSKSELNENQKAYYTALSLLAGVQQTSEEQKSTLYQKQGALAEKQGSYYEKQGALAEKQGSLAEKQGSYYENQSILISYQAWERDFKNRYLYLFGSEPPPRLVQSSFGILKSDFTTGYEAGDTGKVNLKYHK